MTASRRHSADGWRAARRRLCSIDPVLAGVIRATGPCTLVPGFTGAPFNHLTHAIAHQQLNGTAAKTILKRFLAIYGDAEHPTPEQVLTTDPRRLRAAGLSLGKIAAIRDLAAKVLDGTVPSRGIDLESLSDQEIIERLTAVRGIGPWTVQMMLMFQLGRVDVLPVDDFGVRQGFMLAYGLRSMPHPKAFAIFAERWAPWRSIASWYMWRAVDLHREQRLPTPPQPPPRVRKPAKRRRRVVR
jgi:DNA-3-methyladenine glycosylase II